MPTTIDDFLDALDLPSEHPYMPIQEEDVQGDKIDEGGPKEWSIASYFTSVSWEKAAKTTDPARPAKCADVPALTWEKNNDVHICGGLDLSSPHSIGKSFLAATATAQDSIVDIGGSALDFFVEIKPCLISFFRMHIILWAPLILLYCLRRLSRHHPKKFKLHPKRPTVVERMESDFSTESKRYFYEKSKYLNECLILPVLKKMPSFSNYLPSSLANYSATAMDKEKCPRQGGATQGGEGADQSNSFERFLLLLSLITNALSFMASFSPIIFSVEDDKKKETNSKHENLNEKQDSSKISTAEFPFISSNLHISSFNYSGDWLAYLVAVIFSAIIMTDAMYVYDFSTSALVAFHFFVISIGMKRFGSKIALWTALPISVIAFYVMAFQDLNLPNIKPGLYYDDTNPFISEVVKEWPVEKRTYDDGRGTPWMMTGDTRTGVPFLVNKIRTQEYTRRWVPLPDEREAVILDIAFPESMPIEAGKAIYLILHGSNGDSNEGYVVDFVSRQVAEGNIVAVMVTRGLMDSPIIGDNLLHFARISDVAAAAKALKTAAKKLSGDGENPFLLVGVGYSMGGITIANYVAKTGQECNIDLAIAFSGALDTRQQVHFTRSASLWQPFIAKMMRDTLLRKFSRKINKKFNQEQFREMMRAQSLVDFDKAFFAPYNDFETVDDYYSSMGAMGDFVSFDTREDQGSIGNVSIPLCMVQALDDPVGYWGTFHDPAKVAMTGDGNTMILFTQKGGHVGWPLGMIAGDGWRWMSDVASSLVEATGRVLMKQSPNVN